MRGSIYGIAANDIFGIISAMKIVVIALNNVFDTGLAAVLDTLATANGTRYPGILSSAQVRVRGGWCQGGRAHFAGAERARATHGRSKAT